MDGGPLRVRVGRFADLVLRGRGNPVLLDPEICLDLFCPSGAPSRFEDLDIETTLSQRIILIAARLPIMRGR